MNKCGCGCGNVLSNPNATFIRGHHTRVKKNSGMFQSGHDTWNKGKSFRPGVPRHSYDEEFRRKNSLSHIGKNLGNTNGFKKVSIPWNKGKKMSLQRRICQSMKLTGELEFTGFKKPLNRRIRVHPKFVEWRNKVFERDNYICQNKNCKFCNNKKGVELHPHHIVFLKTIIKENKLKKIDEAIECEQLWNIDNGITYCKKYHLNSHLHMEED